MTQAVATTIGAAIIVIGDTIEVVMGIAMSGADENMNMAARAIRRDLTYRPITATINTAQTLTIKAIAMACSRAPTTRVEARLTIRSVLTSTCMRVVDSCRSSDIRLRTARPIATAFSAVMKRDIKTTRRILSAASFADSHSIDSPSVNNLNTR